MNWLLTEYAPIRRWHWLFTLGWLGILSAREVHLSPLAWTAVGMGSTLALAQRAWMLWRLRRADQQMERLQQLYLEYLDRECG